MGPEPRTGEHQTQPGSCDAPVDESVLASVIAAAMTDDRGNPFVEGMQRELHL
jgi:hypothetical protein